VNEKEPGHGWRPGPRLKEGVDRAVEIPPDAKSITSHCYSTVSESKNCVSVVT
jgi:hypothetical protein